MINILNPDGTLNDSAPAKYRGLTMNKAREAVVADIEALGLLGRSRRPRDRSCPLRSQQDADRAVPGRSVVREDGRAGPVGHGCRDDGRVKIVPERYAKGYLDWLGEKRDWPISRQLWWGHRIPIWYAPTTAGTQMHRQGLKPLAIRSKTRSDRLPAARFATMYVTACRTVMD